MIKWLLKISFGIFIFGTILFLGVRCSAPNSKGKKQETSKIDSIRYANLILGTAINDPIILGWYGLSQKLPKTIVSELTKIRREVKDTALGITMHLHTWGDGQNFPPLIIYISNCTGFEYAFTFCDEYYYYRLSHFKPYDESYYEYSRYLHFDMQLNFILSGLGYNKKGKEKEAWRVVSLLEDSLFRKSDEENPRSTEVQIKDTAYWLPSHMKDDSVKKDILRDLIANNRTITRYYKPYEGSGSLWKFQLIENAGDSTFTILPTFVNKEYYRCLFF